MVRPDHVEHPVVGPRAGPPLRVFLEAALRALEGRRRAVRQELGRRERRQPVADGRPAEVEVERAHERLERRCEQRRPAPAAALRFTLAEQQQLAELDARRETRESGRGDDGCPAGGEDSLVVLGMAGVEGLGDGEADDDVAEELEPLVVAACHLAVLVQPARMRQRLLEQVKVADRKGEPRSERLGLVHGSRAGPARRSVPRCNRRRPGRCGSSPHPRPRSPSRTPPRGS